MWGCSITAYYSKSPLAGRSHRLGLIHSLGHCREFSSTWFSCPLASLPPPLSLPLRRPQAPIEREESALDPTPPQSDRHQQCLLVVTRGVSEPRASVCGADSSRHLCGLRRAFLKPFAVFLVRKSKAADERRRSLAKQAREDYKRLSQRGRGSEGPQSPPGGPQKPRRPPLPPKPQFLSPTGHPHRPLR